MCSVITATPGKVRFRIITECPILNTAPAGRAGAVREYASGAEKQAGVRHTHLITNGRLGCTYSFGCPIGSFGVPHQAHSSYPDDGRRRFPGRLGIGKEVRYKLVCQPLASMAL